MSGLSGYDSEVVGFDCVTQDTRSLASSSAQTTEFSDQGVACQTSMSKDEGCMVQPDDVDTNEISEIPLGLNEFLRKVAPAMMEQLEQNDREFINDSSDSDEEDVIAAKLLQEIKLKHGLGCGDHDTSILGVTWSSAGNSIAVSIGAMQHETWCQNSGLIKVFMLKRSEERFVQAMEVTEKDCVSVLKYHPTVAALLAYGTTSGEIVLCNLRNGSLDEGTQLASPAGCHGSRRVSALRWAEAPLANTFLMMQITSKGKRRGGADQVLFSAGCDGSLNAWQVNADQKVFENIICYNINGDQKLAPDITCFDFIESYPLRPADEKVPDDVFVVGTKTGKIFLCKIKGEVEGVDPVYDVLEGHGTCVLDVAFSYQRPGIFVSISMDSELRVYDIKQGSPLKILCLDIPISCMSWLSPPCVVLGLSGCDESLRVYNVNSGRVVPVSGMNGCGDVTCVSVNQFGSCRIAAGDSDGNLKIWELPTRRIKLSDDDLDF
ncbi:dynein axonemal intermediate chain 1-like [Nymphalis io]|uniref:dynein axonemal intermediate chain 1-like n=1 Tax=Inachis io TaxID=171585 RepID=UPI002169A902|nr:dynein axonemal intermediate chain 1-like [Nymphalis io]